MDKTANNINMSNKLNSFDINTYNRLMSLNKLSLLKFTVFERADDNLDNLNKTISEKFPINIRTDNGDEQSESKLSVRNAEMSKRIEELQIKRVRFSDNLETIIKISTINYDNDSPKINLNYHKFIKKYKSNTIKLNLITKIPLNVINRKNISLLFFKMSNIEQNKYTYIQPLDKIDLYSDYEYDIYELQNIDIYLEKKDNLSLKISYTKYFDQENEPNILLNRKRILSTINLDYQEILENYENGNNFVTFIDKYSGIIIKYNLIIY